MRLLFSVTAAVLVLASVAVYLAQPRVAADKPVIYWMTDENPAREQQIELFYQWLEENRGELNAFLASRASSGNGRESTRAECYLLVDSSANEWQKKIIQGVSGVAGDVIDVWCTNIQFFSDIGFLRDVTEEARELGFDVGRTYPAMRNELTVDGRQVAFPCNVTVHLYWVNLNEFERVGMEPPPKSWTLDEFERIGKEYVRRANQPGAPRMHFFADGMDPMVMRRTFGVSTFNETCTRCVLDDAGVRERYVAALRLQKRWMYEDKIIPTPAEQASLASEASYGGTGPQLLNRGAYAMFRSGRYMLIQFRQFQQSRLQRGDEPLRLAVSHPPHLDFPNSSTGTRAAAVYAGSDHQDLAVLFLAYLASEQYNMQIVRDADALPPNPRYTETREFRKPVPPGVPEPPRSPGPDAGDDEVRRFERDLEEYHEQYPLARYWRQGEWGTHEVFADAAGTIAVGYTYSPFVIYATWDRIEREEREKFFNNLQSAEATAAETAVRINEEIQRRTGERPDLSRRYEELVEIQRRVDDRVEQLESLAKDEPVPPELKIPADWVLNAFHRKLYSDRGWLDWD
ncbi:MAG: ABC transporter substrate-binding protein [Phycisphaerae bacterium]